MKTSLAVALVASMSVVGCRQDAEPALWEAFDLLVLAEDTRGRPTLFRCEVFRCEVDDDWETWGPPEPLLSDPRWKDAAWLTTGPHGEAFVVTAREVFRVTDHEDVASVWSDEDASDLVHLAFDPAVRRAYITDRAAAAIHIVDVSSGTWHDERVVTSETLAQPVATRVMDDNIVELVDRASPTLLALALTEGGCTISVGPHIPRDADPIGFVGADDVLGANPKHSGIATLQELRHTLHGYPMDLFYHREFDVLSPRRRALVGGGLSAPGVTPIAGSELVGHATVVLGTSADRTCLVFSERPTDVNRAVTTAQTVVPCENLGRPIGIALVE